MPGTQGVRQPQRTREINATRAAKHQSFVAYERMDQRYRLGIGNLPAEVDG